MGFHADGISENQERMHREQFTGGIHMTVGTAARLLMSYPASAAAFTRLARELPQAAARRELYAGAQVPPMMIVSTTNTCNLSCAGCYAACRQPCTQDGTLQEDGGLSGARIGALMQEASDMGVAVVLLAGGEPLLSHGWLDALAAHPEMLGLVFTNGTLLDTERLDWCGQHRHIVPVLSLEGDMAHTDARRGAGVYARVTAAMDSLRRRGIPFGVSVTATSQNIAHITQPDFAADLLKKGSRLFVMVEYVPVAQDTPLVLSGQEKRRLYEFCQDAGRRHPAVFIPFPGNEQAVGGCMAAGRGFIHISADGDVEPCPFAPFSDVNLRHMSLQQALQSEFLSKVRARHHLLQEGEGGCALWQHRGQLQQWLT